MNIQIVSTYSTQQSQKSLTYHNYDDGKSNLLSSIQKQHAWELGWLRVSAMSENGMHEF